MILGNETHSDFHRKFITKFVAGDHGACVYSLDITRPVLERCWEYEDFRIQCPKCLNNAYIYSFAGNITAGGFWSLHVYCPVCNVVYHRTRVTAGIHWSILKQIADDIIQESKGEVTMQ